MKLNRTKSVPVFRPSCISCKETFVIDSIFVCVFGVRVAFYSHFLPSVISVL